MEWEGLEGTSPLLFRPSLLKFHWRCGRDDGEVKLTLTVKGKKQVVQGSLHSLDTKQ